MALLIAVLLAIAGLQAPQPGTGVIEGIITRGESMQPIEGVRVVIWGDHGPDFETKTDANGHYIFSGLPSGIFNIEAHAAGYLPVPNPSSGATVRLTVADQQRVLHHISMPPASAISGRILGENREPIAGITVEILQLAFDLHGRPAWRGVRTAKTNDTGEYRFEELPAGNYYLRATRKPTSGSPGVSSVTEMTMTYFPGTLDAPTAAAIHLLAGDEANADFPLLSGRTYSIAGTVTDSDLSKVASVRLHSIPQDPRIPLDSVVTAGVSVSGDFQLRGLLPGIYDLFAVSFASVSSPMRLAKASVEIRDEDVKDVRLVLGPPVDVKGRISVSGGEEVLAFEASQGEAGPIQVRTQSDSVQIRLNLNRRDFIGGLVILRPTILHDGTLTFSDVPAGTYEVSFVEYGSRKLYLADVRESARSVFDDGLEIFDKPIDSLEVVLGFNGGTVEGKIVSTKKSPVLVVLAPQTFRRKNVGLFKTIRLEDASQPFKFSAIAPGLYSLFAFELASPEDSVSYMNSDFLSLDQTQGVALTVEKGTTAGPFQVPLIPQ